MNDLGNLLQLIYDLLSGWFSAFTDHAVAVLAKLDLIEDDTSSIKNSASDIKNNTDDIKDNTGAIITPVQSIKTNTDSIKTDTTSIKNNVSTMTNQLGTINTNVGTAKAFTEDVANNTLDIKDKVVTIASDTTQIRSNTNTVVTDLDKVYEALKWSLMDKVISETVEGDNLVSFDTDLNNNLVELDVSISATQSGTGDPTPDNVRPITGITDKSIIVNGNNVTITFGHTVFGGIIDAVSGILSITKKGFTISEKSWGYNSQYGFMSVPVPDIKLPDNATPLEGLICEVYTTRKASATGSNPINYSIAGINTRDIRILDTNYNSTASFISAMGSYKIVYPLEVPQIILLTPSQIATIKGINTISSDGTIKCTYEESVKHYLDKQE